VFVKALEGLFIDRMEQNEESFDKYMNDADFFEGGVRAPAEAGVRADTGGGGSMMAADAIIDCLE
jgi:hypothetical protein